jgi:hypothetical protein
VHHIPNRKEFFEQLKTHLAPGGVIFCFDPSHYLVRWTRLLAAMWTDGYISKKYYSNRDNLSTHSFCTLGEYQSVIRRVGDLRLVKQFYEPANRAKKFPYLVKLFPRFLSVEMGVLIRRD